MMVERWLKIVSKSWNKEEILMSVNKILLGDLKWLDIKKLQWKKDYYRCRIWKFRIIFYHKNWKYFVVEGWYRWDVY